MDTSTALEHLVEELGVLPEESGLASKNLALQPNLLKKAEKGIYTGYEPPRELVERLKRKMFGMPPTAAVRRDLKLDAERWIKERLCTISPEEHTHWVVASVNTAFRTVPKLEAQVLWDMQEDRHMMKRAGNLAIGEPTKPITRFQGWWMHRKAMATRNPIARWAMPYTLGVKPVAYYRSPTPR